MSIKDKFIKAILRDGSVPDGETFLDMAHEQCHEFIAEFSKIAVPSREDLPIMAAAYKLMGESMYGIIDDDEKKICDFIIKTATVCAVVKQSKTEEGEKDEI